MRTTALLLTTILLHAFTTGYAQITYSASNTSLREVLSVIEKQTGFYVIANNNLVVNAKPVTIDAKNLPVTAFLDSILKFQHISYAVRGKTIILTGDNTAGAKGKPHQQATADQATEVPIRGLVADGDGTPLPGASVTIKGSKQSTVTNAQGIFKLSVNPGDVLQVTYIGYKPTEFNISPTVLSRSTHVEVQDNNASFTITLKRSEISIREVVINKGYYTESKILSTGSVSSISAKEIEKQPVTNVLSAMEGKVAGVFIAQTTGVTGGGMDIQIRGINSIAAGRNPLFIIDGVPFSGSPVDQNGTGGYFYGINNGGNPLNTLNPGDIASIDVLKDADATAIYGSRGANGVVLITTKRGQTGVSKVDINFSSGAGRVTRFAPVLGLQDYLTMRKEAFQNDSETPNSGNAPDLVDWSQSQGTDWQKEIIGKNASFTDASVAFSGGNEKDKYIISGSYHRELAVYPGEFGYRRGGLHFSFDHTSKNNKFGLSLMSFYNKDRNIIPAFFDPVNVFSLPPNFPARNPDGSFFYHPDYNNPYSWLLARQKSNSDNTLSNLTLRYTLLKGLNLKVSAGYNKIDLIQTITRPKPVLGSLNNLAIYTNNNTQSLILEPQIQYSDGFGKTKLEVLAGGSYQESRFVMPYYIYATNYSSDALLDNIASAGRINSITNSQSIYRYASGYGKFTYNFDDKYVLNGILRRDGSSRFAPGKQFGNFGSIGVAWIFTNENFIKSAISWLSYGKIRSSYGSTGNDQIPDYGYLDTYMSNTYPYGSGSAIMPSRVANPNFSWEVTKKLEGAIELGFADNRIMFNLNYFRNRSDNMLVGTPLTPQTGFTEYQSNFPATVQNNGLEWELSIKAIQRSKFSWNASFNLTNLKNKLVDFPGLKESSFRDMYIIGKPLTLIAFYEFTGFKSGIPTVADKDGDNSMVPGIYVNGGGDFIAAGQTAPYYFGGLNNSFQYGNWDLDFLFQFVKQDGLHMRSYNSYSVPGLAYNQDNKVLSDGLRLTVTAGSPAYIAYNYYTASTAMIQDASYIRLRNLSLSYSFKGEWLVKKGVSSCRINVRAQNLITITKYLGFDPEVKSLALPPLKTITAGVQVTL
ncbi:SusC/RagA family TonB-linked outer membrane protein [Chitinophaga sp. RCC_12]|uniref:SusC/RagA family TonB-linked outer membrane protein n=1 Tax=Chitinophaga sp. RCC_12 TaxID=3239226 RepID=UPI00352495E1